jgi:antitoxin HicB
MMKKHIVMYEREGGAAAKGGATLKKVARRIRAIPAKRAPRRAVRALAAGEHAYAAVFEPVEEGGYVVRFPAFGYLATQGDTLTEARAMAADCLEGHIECLLEAGEELPQSDVAMGLPKIEIVRIKPKPA